MFFYKGFDPHYKLNYKPTFTNTNYNNNNIMAPQQKGLSNSNSLSSNGIHYWMKKTLDASKVTVMQFYNK